MLALYFFVINKKNPPVLPVRHGTGKMQTLLKTAIKSNEAGVHIILRVYWPDPPWGTCSSKRRYFSQKLYRWKDGHWHASSTAIDTVREQKAQDDL